MGFARVTGVERSDVPMAPHQFSALCRLKRRRMSLERTEIVRPSVRGNEERKATTVSLHGQRLPRLGFTMNAVDQARIQQADTVGPLEQHRDQQLPVALDQIGELHAAPRRIALWRCAAAGRTVLAFYGPSSGTENHTNTGAIYSTTQTLALRTPTFTPRSAPTTTRTGANSTHGRHCPTPGL